MTAPRAPRFLSLRTLRLTALAILTGLVLVVLAGRMELAGAQPAPTPVPTAAPAGAPLRVDQLPPAPAGDKIVEVPRSATNAGKSVSRRDVVESAVKATTAPAKRTKAGLAIAFWAFAALTVLGALFVITRKNLIVAVMGMVGTFFALAALYMLLYAHFLAIIQMLVYAGAIMVLFVFVIMILNKPEDEPYAVSGRFGKILAGVAMLYMLYRVGAVLVAVPVDDAEKLAPAATAEGHAWGSTAAVGWNLFNDYLFPFEAVSILLLIAVVGAIAVARPLSGPGADETLDGGGAKPAPGGH